MHLSSDERQALESIARKYTSPYCDVIRAKIILLADERWIFGYTQVFGSRAGTGPPRRGRNRAGGQAANQEGSAAHPVTTSAAESVEGRAASCSSFACSECRCRLAWGVPGCSTPGRSRH